MARLANRELAHQRRRQIMDAAIACFRRRGFHQATMAEICAEASISAGALYRYFSSKAEIIAAIAEDRVNENDEAFQRVVAQGGLVAGVTMIARAFFDKFAEGNGGLIADIIAEAIRDDALSASLLASDERRRKRLVKAIQSAQSRGEADPSLDPAVAAHTLLAAIEGIGMRRAFLRDGEAEAAAAEFRTLAERYLRSQS